MYFWNIKQLIQDLKNNQVTQAQFKNYYLVSGIFVLLGYFVYSQTAVTDLKISFASLLIQCGLLITWLSLIFNANGGEQGQQFLNRFIALMLPISIRVAVAMVFIWLTFEFLIQGYKTEVSAEQAVLIQNLLNAAFDVVISFMVYWRIYVAMRQVNTPA